MSGVMLIRDPDPARRRAGLAAAERVLRRFDLTVSSIEHGVVGLAWGAFAGAPVRHAPGAFVLGDVIPGPGPERLDAAGYAAACAGREVPPAFDGLHVAATFDEAGALSMAADVLGTFQVYAAEADERLWIATSPALITAQPGFRAELDPDGLVALLVTNGSFRGRTPCRGIRRLAPGHAWVAAPGAPVRAALQYRPPVHTESHDVPLEESALRLHETLLEATKRHVPSDQAHTMLLSGGIDSRLLSGVLARLGIPFEAITRGIASDLEYRCARAVARHLGLRHHLVPHGAGSFESFERTLWWDGLAAGPGSGGNEGLGEALQHAQPSVVSGYLADSVMGTVMSGKAFDREARRASADRYIQRNNVWGVSLEALPKLLRADVFGDALERTLAALREDFMASGDSFLERAWRFDLEHRQRYVMGRMFPRIAFSAWPRAPQCDREVLRVVGGIPFQVTGKKRLEREMLERFHTGLARLPLDRNDLDTTPLLPGVMDLVRAGVDRRVRHLRTRIGMPRPERRYYHRTFDFNGPVWRRTRAAAAADRERLYALFERDALDAFLPPADAPWTPTGLIEGAAGVKMLTAIGVWLRVGLG